MSGTGRSHSCRKVFCVALPSIWGTDQKFWRLS